MGFFKDPYPRSSIYLIGQLTGRVKPSKSERGTYGFCFALGCFLRLRCHCAGDGTAVEAGTLVLLVHSDQPTDVCVGRRRALNGSGLLIKHRLCFGVLATFPRQEVVPHFPIFRRAHAVSTQLYSRVLSVSSGQERPDSSTYSSSSACAIRGGVFAMARFGGRRFGTDARHQTCFIGSRLRAWFGDWADPVGTILQVHGELFEPLCHCNSDGNLQTSLPVPALCISIHQGPRDAPLEITAFLTKDFRCFILGYSLCRLDLLTSV